MIRLNFFLVLLVSVDVKCDAISSVGFLSSIINATLEGMRPNLKNIYIPYENFQTGPQEIGMLEGNFREVTLQGLDKFSVKIIDTTFFDINNLTVVDEEIIAKGLYSINGTLAFPLGKKDIHLHGDGEFGAKMTNLSVSTNMKIKLENGKKVVKQLDLTVGLNKLNIYLKNLMGGGDLEVVFNKLLNDVGLTVFNYYKEPFLEIIKSEVRKFITEMLNRE